MVVPVGPMCNALAEGQCLEAGASARNAGVPGCSTTMPLGDRRAKCAGSVLPQAEAERPLGGANPFFSTTLDRRVLQT